MLETNSFSRSDHSHLAFKIGQLFNQSLLPVLEGFPQGRTTEKQKIGYYIKTLIVYPFRPSYDQHILCMHSKFPEDIPLKQLYVCIQLLFDFCLSQLHCIKVF